MQTGFLDREVSVAGSTYRYQVYVPRDYSSSDEWPLILSLHGSGERGNDGVRQTQIGIAAAIRSNPDRYPAIVVFPQAPLSDSGWHGAATDIASAALENTLREFRTDRNRVYLTGLSMGGNGAWLLASREPHRFAALIVVCGFVDDLVLADGTSFPAFPGAPQDRFTALAETVRDIPVWVFHGELDPVVPVQQSRRIVEELRELGAVVQYTEFPDTGHNAWQPAYDMESLTRWLFAQRRRDPLQ